MSIKLAQLRGVTLTDPNSTEDRTDIGWEPSKGVLELQLLLDPTGQGATGNLWQARAALDELLEELS